MEKRLPWTAAVSGSFWALPVFLTQEKWVANYFLETF